MTIQEIAATISTEDRELILNSGKQIRRSRIDIVHDTAKQKQVPDTSVESKRSSVDREWPAVGTAVKATNPWTGEVHDVTVIENKRRKHGVEFETATGNRFHSPSPLCQYLFGKRVSNGWNCISW